MEGKVKVYGDDDKIIYYDSVKEALEAMTNKSK